MIIQITKTDEGMLTTKLDMILAFEDTGGFEFFIYFKGIQGLKARVSDKEYSRIKKLWMDAHDKGEML